MSDVIWPLVVLFAGSLLLLVLFAAADVHLERRAAARRRPVIARGWRGWEWDEPVWDSVWPLSPGERWLADWRARNPAPSGEIGTLIPAIWADAIAAEQAKRLDLVHGLDHQFLHGARSAPWIGF